MDSLLIAEWQKANPFSFIAIRLALPGKTLRLTSGGTVRFTPSDEESEATFDPEDLEYGVLSSVGTIEDGEVDAAVAPDLGFQVYQDDALEAMTAAEAQGSEWTLYWGAVDPETGAVVGQPVEWFTGRLNVSALAFDESSRNLTISTYTEEQFQLQHDAAQRLSNAFHQSVWPGELGLSHVTAVLRKIYWRMTEPRRSLRTGGGGGGSNPGPGIWANLR